jgi:hypothetical protein
MEVYFYYFKEAPKEKTRLRCRTELISADLLDKPVQFPVNVDSGKPHASIYTTPSDNPSTLFMWIDSETFLLGIIGLILIPYRFIKDPIFKMVALILPEQGLEMLN